MAGELEELQWIILTVRGADVVNAFSHRGEHSPEYGRQHLTLRTSRQQSRENRHRTQWEFGIEQRLTVDGFVSGRSAVSRDVLRRSSGKGNPPDLLASRAIRPEVEPFPVARPKGNGILRGSEGDSSRCAPGRIHDIDFREPILAPGVECDPAAIG